MEKAERSSQEILRERAFFHWLYNIEGIGRKTIRRLMDAVGSAERIFNLEEEKLDLLLSDSQKRKLLEARGRAKIRQEYEAIRRRGIDLYPASDPLYPKRLLPLPDRPEAVYVKGRLPEERVPAVAVIGARICSAYGAYMAEQFCASLASAGVCIISGLARGIDGIGQRAALRAGGTACAVLGCGPDLCYPPENRQLYDSMIQRGAVVSEYPPGTPPRAGLFPQRNRIISGLADLILVIEAREKSGTLITVDMALEQGKEVWAVPGRITDELSRGCNRLIWQGASPALSPSALLEELRRLSALSWKRPAQKEAEGRCGQPAENGTRAGACGEGLLTEKATAEEERLRTAILNALDFSAVTPERLQEELRASGISCSLPGLIRLLMELTLEGSCVQEGNRFCRKMTQETLKW